MLTLLLVPQLWLAQAWAGQPWDASETGWLTPPNDERPPREQRPYYPPERSALTQADGNFVAPRYQASDEAKLMDAARQGDVEAVRALLKAGANPNIGDYWRDVPLLAAVR
ncbi:MAG: hypothetical protein B7X94_01860, partial [Hydrogenophilales bacterium 17-62-8]